MTTRWTRTTTGRSRSKFRLVRCRGGGVGGGRFSSCLRVTPSPVGPRRNDVGFLIGAAAVQMSVLGGRGGSSRDREGWAYASADQQGCSRLASAKKKLSPSRLAPGRLGLRSSRSTSRTTRDGRKRARAAATASFCLRAEFRG